MNPNGEAGSGNLPPPNGPKNPWESALDEIDAPKKNDIGIGTVIECMRSLQKEFQRNHTSWNRKDVVDSIKKDIDFEEPVIRAPVEIAKGDNPILVLNYQQLDAVGQILNFSISDVTLSDYYVLVKGTGKDPKKIEAKLKFASIKPMTENHVVISTGLAKELGVEEQKKDIRILSVYQKIKDIDLDKL